MYTCTAFKAAEWAIYGVNVTINTINDSFNINLEHMIISTIYENINLDDCGQLNQIFGDIKVSILINKQLKKTPICYKDNTKSFINNITSMYITQFSNYNTDNTISNDIFKKLCESNKLDDELINGLKISKQFFEKSIQHHDVVVNISDTDGRYDYNVLFFNRDLRIISSLREYIILKAIGKKEITIEELYNETLYDEFIINKILIKLEYVLLIKKIDNKDKISFTMNNNFKLDYINLFNYDINVILEKKEVNYSYLADPNYIFMDEDFNQYEIAVKMFKPISRIFAKTCLGICLGKCLLLFIFF